MDTVEGYRKIYVGLDGSELSNAAMRMGLCIGKHDGAALIGSHVYAAKLHDRRFRAMESGLPEEYQKENELERQRETHDSLITKGLKLISDSHLEVMEKACRERGLSFTGVSLEGKNWQELAGDVNRHDYDLIVLGGHGVGRVAGAMLGTVTARILRRVKRDILICKVDTEQHPADHIVVCLDGSERSWGALKRGIRLAKAFRKKLVAISVFDPYFHYSMFSTLNHVLSEEAAKVFKFQEQEKLHETIIDAGLAKIYQSHLEIARQIAAEDKLEIQTHLLDGKAYEKILEFVRGTSTWLLIMGRIGIHSDEDMDVGGQAENVCRLADCNILLVEAKHQPSVEYQAEATVTWTKEATSILDRVPAMARGVAMKAIQRHCIAEGHTVVTTSVLNAAIKQLLPPEALERMGIPLDDEACLPSDRHQPSAGAAIRPATLAWTDAAVERLQRVPEGFMRNAAQNTIEEYARVSGVREITLEVSERGFIKAREKMAAAMQGGMPAGPGNGRKNRAQAAASASFECQMCGFVVDGDRPEECPSCQVDQFREMTKAERGLLSDTATLILAWDQEALERIEKIPAGFMRKMTQCRIELWARKHSHERVTLEVVEAKYRSWTDGTPNVVCQLDWSEDAFSRVKKIPEFIRPVVIEEIERNAEASGHSRVDGEVIDRVISQWGCMGEFHHG